jgi:hypothetical protein
LSFDRYRRERKTTCPYVTDTVGRFIYNLN